MAKQDWTVMVSGLPTDIDGERLTDKLVIHFQRAKNGGGEVEFVTLTKATPAFALITFEDREVAHRVIQHGRHILEVDGKSYVLTATEYRESLEPDKVIVSLSAIVNCRQLPGGIPALKNLHKSHPGVEINYDAEEFCTLHGRYSKVQAALDQILGHPGDPQSAHRDTGQPEPACSTSVQTTRRSHDQGSENHSRKPKRQREQSTTARHPSSHSDLVTSGYGAEDSGLAESADLCHSGHTAPDEDLSLIVDADMFQYLQKHCWREYQHILSQYGVEVVDMTNQGLTTLFLQVAAGREGGQEQERRAMARKALSQLYQENETKIRRALLPKSILSPRGGLQMAIESLKVRLPKLLLNEDDRNINIVGSDSDVSEAKQFLLLDHDKVSAKKDDRASLPGHSSYDSGSFSPGDEVGATTMSSAEGRLDGGQERSGVGKGRAGGSRRCKLAALLKEPGLAALGDRPTDFTVRGLSSPGKQTGPILGHDVLSEAAAIPGGRDSTGNSHIAGGDISFKSGDLSSSLPNNTSSTLEVTDTGPKNLTCALSTTQSSLSGSTVPPFVESGSLLKRANSFSGMPKLKTQAWSQRSHDDSSESDVRARGRPSSFSTQTKGRDKREVYSAEVTVFMGMWQHIKEAYSTQVRDLTSDVQMKENRLQGSSEVTLTVSGSNPSRVRSCQLGLQKLVESVKVDFCVHELLLPELGLTDPADETLQACCAEMRSRFKKVTVQVLNKSLFLLGPKQLCSQVGATLCEVFSGDVAQTPKQQDFSAPPTSNWNQPTSFQMNEDQNTFESNAQVMLESQTGTDGGQGTGTNHKTNMDEKEPVNGRVNPASVIKPPVIKQAVKMMGTETDGQEASAPTNNATEGSTRPVNGVGSATACSDQTTGLHKKERAAHLHQRDGMQQQKAEIKHTAGEFGEGQGEQGYICLCGDNGTSVTRTKCGATLCSKCLRLVHVHCRVCRVPDSTPQGIQGKMSLSKVHIPLPGHNSDTAIKITYSIPDGIQGSDHPYPGHPFQGGEFEAFLPDCEMSRKLLPRLEKAFRLGLTFTVRATETGARVTWDSIPHKTSLQGGKSGKGYPDSTYLTRLSQALTSHWIEE